MFSEFLAKDEKCYKYSNVIKNRDFQNCDFRVLRDIFGEYFYNKSYFKLKSTILGAKNVNNAFSVKTLLHDFDDNYLFNRVFLIYLEEFFEGYAY